MNKTMSGMNQNTLLIGPEDHNILQDAISSLSVQSARLSDIPIPGTEYDGRYFQNPIFSLHMDPAGINIHPTGRTTSFGELSDLRKESRNNQPLTEVLGSLAEPSGRLISNVGVSVVITLNYQGGRYALLEYRAKDQRHMLLSGYLDSATLRIPPPTTRGLVVSHALAEVQQELVTSDENGCALRGEVGGSLIKRTLKELIIGCNESLCTVEGEPLCLGEPYRLNGISYHPEKAWRMQSRHLPNFLNNLHPCSSVFMAGLELKDVGFQFAKQWNAGQIFMAFELDLPSDEKQLFLFHAEDGPISEAQPWELQTSLKRDGLVLFELNQAEQLTGNTFWLRNGQLVPRFEFESKQMKMSEAFASAPDGDIKYKGVTHESDITFGEYQANLQKR